jgi:ankyrin repeat protein
MDSLTDQRDTPTALNEHAANMSMAEHKSSRMQTIVEVFKCEFAKPARTSSEKEQGGLQPSKDWKPLHYAAFYGREAALIHFLRAGQSPDGVSGTVETPLLIAIAAGHEQIVKILCAAGADVNAATEDKGETALHLAINLGRSHMIDVLLAYRPNLEAQTLQGHSTPLHCAAAKSGSLATVLSLLVYGASYEALNKEACTPAEVALRNNNIQAAVAIISSARESRSKLVREKELLLRYVEKTQNRYSMNNELIADIFEAGCGPESTVLVEAIKRDDARLVEMFLEKGADPDRPTAKGLYPLFVALGCSDARIIQLLVDHKVDTTVRDIKGHNVLQVALEKSLAHDPEAMRKLFETLILSGADPEVTYPDGKTLLHCVVKQGSAYVKVAQLLLKVDVDVNQQDSFGCTALHLAGRSRICIEVLLKHGAIANLPNNNGLTPLLGAISTADQDTEIELEPLIKASNLKVTDECQKTALHFAAERGLAKAARLLLKCGAGTTLVDLKGQTPLMTAVLHQQWSIVPLLANQPGINCWDENGMTALHYLAITMPKSPSTWKDIAKAAEHFCGRSVSRSMRDRTGATPLIQAVKALPEEGRPVLEALLVEKGRERSSCVGHEDHDGHSALFYATTMSKVIFTEVLLEGGAPFAFKDWIPKKARSSLGTEKNKRILKVFAEFEWMRRSRILRRTSKDAPSVSVLSTTLPLQDLRHMLTMGLDPNALPTWKSNVKTSLLWTVLGHTLVQPPLPPNYLLDMMKLVFEYGADPNATSENAQIEMAKDSAPQDSARHPITFLLEQSLDVDIDLITLFLDNGAKLTISSPFYEGRYPLHSAIKAGRKDIITRFIAQKVNLETLDLQKRTPLHIAANQGDADIFDVLLQSVAKIDVQDVEGNTPLHCAAASGHSKIVARLLREGARVIQKNKKGKMPLECVSDAEGGSEKDKVIKLLKYAEEQERKKVAAENLRKNSRSPANSTGVLLKPSKSATTLLSPSASPLLAASKSSPQPRIDSGFGHARSTASTPEPLASLSRDKATFDQSGSGKGKEESDEQEELASWLAVSRALDRL